MFLRVYTIAFILSIFATPALGEVSNPHLGLTLVTQPNRATLIIDLCATGVELRATQYAEKKKTAKQWGEQLGLHGAVNGDFFDFPDATLVLGRAMGDWEWWPWGTAWVDEQTRPYWQMGPQWVELVEFGLDDPFWLTKDIVGAHNTLVSDGVIQTPWMADAPLLNSLHKRTGYGLSKTRRKMVWTVVHEKITGEELVAYMMADVDEAGAPPIWWASNQDGGGSSQLWVEAAGFVMPSTRLVANHMGVFANGLGGTSFNCAQVGYEAELVESSFPLTIVGFGSLGTVTLEWGESVSGTITFKNKGSETWTPNTTKLAPTPIDVPHPLAATNWLSSTRISTPSISIPSQEEYSFPVTLQGNSPGSHFLELNLVEEGVAWFFDETIAGGPPLGVIGIQVEVTNEVFCEPDCSNAVCGGDGCGGSCGNCPAGTLCQDGVCLCIPICGGAQCGDDGCGGSCGQCPTGTLCQDGTCLCIPSCDGAECGDDGCGGSCGNCPTGTLCQNGACLCVPGCGEAQCGNDGCGGSCGQCGTEESCIDGLCTCFPSCDGSSCGDNGCGGSCGTCDPNEFCFGGKCICSAGDDCDFEDDGVDAPAEDVSDSGAGDIEASPDTPDPLADTENADTPATEDLSIVSDSPSEDRARPNRPDTAKPAPDEEDQGLSDTRAKEEEDIARRTAPSNGPGEPGSFTPHDTASSDEGCRNASRIPPSGLSLTLLFSLIFLVFKCTRKAQHYFAE